MFVQANFQPLWLLEPHRPALARRQKNKTKWRKDWRTVAAALGTTNARMRRQQAQAGLPPALESGVSTAAAGRRVRASAERFRRRPAYPGSPRATIGCAAGARRVKGRARAGYKAAKVTARAGARGPPGVPFAARAPSPPTPPGSHGGSERTAGQLPHRRSCGRPGSHGVRCRRRGALPDCAEVSARPAARGPDRRPAPARLRRSPTGWSGLLADARRFLLLHLYPHPLKPWSGSSLRPWLGEGAAAYSSLRGLRSWLYCPPAGPLQPIR